MALNTTTKLTLKDVYDNFDKYNFLIFTNMGTVDTSDFNACKLPTDQIFGDSAQDKKLVLYKKAPINAKLSATHIGFETTDMDGSQMSDTYTDVYIEKYVYLIDDFMHQIHGGSKNTKEHAHMVQKILVKSVRNFLENQEKIQKI